MGFIFKYSVLGVVLVYFFFRGLGLCLGVLIVVVLFVFWDSGFVGFLGVFSCFSFLGCGCVVGSEFGVLGG